VQIELFLEWAGGQVDKWARSVQTPAQPPTRPSVLPAPAGAGARGAGNGNLLLARLQELGLPRFESITTHRNEQVMLSWIPGKVLRIHEGYSAAPDDVLQAIVRFVSPGVRRPARLAARRTFLAFPVDQYAARPARPARKARIAPQDRAAHERLVGMYQELNRAHFDGMLQPIPIRISGRMRSRLGELRLDRKTGAPLHIGISRRHIRRDGWDSVTDTLLHEMVHQWQAETGVPVDHGRGFRQKARLVGIEPRAVRRDW
jgi:SprT-like family